MTQTYRYSEDPKYGSMPAPVLPLKIGPPYGSPTTEVEALVDSGASCCCIPLEMVGKLNLPVHRRNVPTNTAGGKVKFDVYGVIVGIEGKTYCLPVLGLNLPFAIVGRDILNSYEVKLDGPRLTLEISDP